MNRHQRIGQRLLTLFIGALVLFNYPVIHLFVRDQLVWGIPILYVYIFAAWLGLIGVAAFVIER